MRAKPLVYIMSPYTTGDQAINVKSQIDMFSTLLTDGRCIPFAPLMCHFIHMHHPRSYDTWVDYCLNMVRRADYGLRIAASDKALNYYQYDSHGADTEEDLFKMLYKPVFKTYESLCDWLVEWHTADRK